MKALITGASSGLGRDFAFKLAEDGYDLVLVARNIDALESIQSKIKTNCEIESVDLSDKENVYKLFDKYKGQIDLLINNAGFGECGFFSKTELENDINMINLNVIALHMLTKLFLKDFISKDCGQILNVSSLAAFQPGPLMATYYSTKSYVYNLTMSIYEELRRNKSKVRVSVLCPGPTETGFNDRAHVKFSVKPMTSDYVTTYTLKKLKKNKLLIIPNLKMRLCAFGVRFMPRKLLLKITYNIQERKIK